MSDTITFNGNEYDPETFEQGVAMVRNGIGGPSVGAGGADMSSNPDVIRRFGKQYGGERDISDVLGYDSLETEAALERYRAKFERQDIAKRVVEAFPRETWKEPPEVTDEGDGESDFEKKANQYIQGELTHYWRRGDIAQRLGEYGLLFFAFADGQDLSEPVNQSALSTTDDVAYIGVFPQDQCEEWELGKDTDGEASDPSHERFNKPVRYYLDFGDIDAESTDDDFRWVHWTRVFPHMAEDALETDLKGQPALKPIYNLLDDRLKVVGASAEMFYTGADRKIIGNVSKDFALPQYSDKGEREDFKGELSKLVNDLQQTMVGAGMEYTVIDGQEVDPSGVVDEIDSSIASTIGMPKNKLQGNESGERATTQDRRSWFDNISSRRTNFAESEIVRATIDQLIEYGVLPDPNGGDYAVEWPNLFELSEDERAKLESNRAAALSGSQLATSLSSEAKMQYLKEGTFPDDDGPEMELPANEDDPMVRKQFLGEIHNASFSEGDEVDTPAGPGVIVERRTSEFEGPDDETIEASEDSPAYVVGVEDGVRVYESSELEEGEIDVEVPSPEEDLADNSDLSTNQPGRFNYPQSWKDSDTPSRLILLKAWSGMGGTFTGCEREMRGNISSTGRFCGAMKDRVLGGWTGWRDGGS